ncbi:MAG TPA: hypothetical protein VGD88_06885 [Opitutaceae bacterium]
MNVTLDTILHLLHGSKPFTLKMASGRIVDVPHPDFVALAPSRTALVFAKNDGWVETLRINQIESIEAQDEAAAT